MNIPLLQVHNYSLQRGELSLCHNLNFNLHSGEICQLMGDNGVGKTTLLMQLANILPVFQVHTESYIKYNEVLGVPRKVVYISHQLGINTHLTVKQNVCFLLQLYGITADDSQIHQALTWIGLHGLQDMPCIQLSAGLTRRVNLSRLYFMQPKHANIWLLDEPFTALDKQIIMVLEHRMQEFAAAGGTILVSSHQVVSVADNHVNLNDFIDTNLNYE